MTVKELINALKELVEDYGEEYEDYLNGNNDDYY